MNTKWSAGSAVQSVRLRLAADAAGVRRVVRGDNPAVGFTEHPAGDRTYVVAVNYGPEPAECRIEAAARIVRVFGGGTLDGGVLRLPANDGAVLDVPVA